MHTNGHILRHVIDLQGSLLVKIVPFSHTKMSIAEVAEKSKRVIQGHLCDDKLFLFLVKHEFRKLFFVTCFLKVLHDDRPMKNLNL